MSYIIWKLVPDTQSPKKTVKVYLSPTGRWIKSSANAAAFSYQTAQDRARELNAFTRVYSFRN